MTVVGTEAASGLGHRVPARARSYAAEVRAAAERPYVHIRRVGAGLVATGAPHCVLGHQIAPGDGRVDGIFAEWTWDGAELHVRNDRYGFFPLFYFLRPGEICLSPSILTLLREGAPRELDDAALAVFVRLGYFIGEDTPFRAIRAVPPAAEFRWRDERVAIAGRYAIRGPQAMRRAEAVDGYVALFRQAIRRRLPPPDRSAVLLSGGVDSRHILFELCEAGQKPTVCVTAYRYFPSALLARGVRPSAEMRIAADVAAAVGVDHVMLAPPRSQLRAEMRKNLLTSFCAEEGAWYLALADCLRGRVSAGYDGIGGDVLSDGHFLDEEVLRIFESRRGMDLTRRLVPAAAEDVLATLLAPEARARFGRELAMARLAGEVERHLDAANPLDSFLFWNRARREVALTPFAMLDGVGVVFAPFLDWDLYDFLASIPAAMLADKRLHIEVLQRAHPRHAGIPFPAKAGAGALKARFRRLAAEMAWHAARQPAARVFSRAQLGALLLRAATEGTYRWVLPMVVLLLQLEGIARDGVPPTGSD